MHITADDLVSAFVGVIATLILALLASLALEHYRRFRDRQSLAAALIGELSGYTDAYPTLRAAYPSMIDQLRKGICGEIPPVPATRDFIYESNVSSIGSLGPKAAEDVAYVYQNLTAYRNVHVTLAQIYRDRHAEHKYTNEQFAFLAQSGSDCAARAHDRTTGLISRLRIMVKQNWLESIFYPPS
jgi:hypothetical protein